MMRSMTCVIVTVCLIATARARGAEPATSAEAGGRRQPAEVGRQIDQQIQRLLAEKKLTPSPLADDAEFLRRAFLDIVGRIPTLEEATAFLDSKEPDKRARLVDRLLASSDYGQHFGKIWRDLITAEEESNWRYLGQAVPLFTRWLTDGFNENRGWDRMVYDMLTAEGSLEKNPQIVFILSNREMKKPAPNKIVASTVQLFMGTQLQCAECHRHPFVREWKPADFWGLAAFFSHVQDHGRRNNGQYSIQPMIVEADGPPGYPKGGPAPLPGAAIALLDPTDSTKVLKKEDGTPVVARARYFSVAEEPALAKGPYRPHLATWLTSPQNKFFARAAVNRWWAHFFGRGLAHPIDDLDGVEEPAHPELLLLLADEFKASGFDLKHLVRCLCASQAYQRTSRPLPDNASDHDNRCFARMGIKLMTPEVLYSSLGVVQVFRAAGGNPKYRTQFFSLFDAKNVEDPAELVYGIRQFLMMINGPEFNSASPLVGSLTRSGAAGSKVIEGLYLATLARRPTEAEARRMADYVARSSSPAAGYGKVLWVLVNSAEFIHNH